MADVTLSLVVPCFNEETVIPHFYQTVNESMGESNIDYEFIFVDDGSSDDTLKIARELSERDGRVHYVSFSRNFGKEAAMLAGLQKARGDFVVTMDADLQDPPGLIPQMLEAVVSGTFDCAATRRVTRKGEPPVRSFLARRFYAFMKKITDIEIVDGARDFRLMNRKYVNAVLSLPERNRFSKGIYPWVGFKTKWFVYENIQRVAGETSWSLGKLFLYAMDGIIAFSEKPLAIVSVCGILMFLASLFMIGGVIMYKLVFNKSAAGWASTACIILFSSGLQIFCTGILGQYMARMYSEVKNRPVFIVREEK
jgi:glycosyltransferase involved in cell wall biosynthesis